MKQRNILLGMAAGFTVGYAAYRAYEAMQPISEQRARRDAAAYGRIRRRLMLAGMLRSSAAAASLAYGVPGTAIERIAIRAPLAAQGAVFALLAGVLQFALEFPTDYVEGYALERRFGNSEQPLASWLTDKFKGEAIAAGVTALLSAALAWAVRRFPQTWAMMGSAAAFPLLVAANVVVPSVIMPMFNTYSPLEGPLELRLRALATRYGVGNAHILRMDMSKQTKKANAFVTGIGHTHRIVVGDTLIENFTDDEIEFIVAHELGHYVTRDSWRLIVAGEIVAAAVLMGAFELLRDHSAETSNRPITLARIAFWCSLLAQVLQPMIAAFSRSREWAADHFALQATGAPATGASAFRRLRDQNLAEDQQPWWYEALFATHPSLKTRIRRLDRASGNLSMR